MTVKVSIWTLGEAIGPVHIDRKLGLLLRLALEGMIKAGYRSRHTFEAIPWLTIAPPAVV